MRWVPPLGVLGAAIGAIAIGTAATSTSITTIISIETTIRTSIGVKLARATTGSTIRNTAEMLLMVTGKRRISSAPMLASSLGAELPIARAAEPELETVPEAAEPEHGQAAGPVPSRAVELEHDPVAAELEHGLVAGPVPSRAVELEHDPVAVELEHGPVAAALELSRVEGLGLVQVAVAPRTKWVTAAHHRGLVAVPRVEDLAAAAETTRVPVAAEVGTAWEAAATAVVVAVEA